MPNFLKTVNSFRRNPFLNPWQATLRHGLWQIRKAMGRFPVCIEREGIRLMAHKEIRNGVGGLFNSAGFWDPNNMRLVRTLAEKGLVSSLSDIGANVGLYSLIAGRFIPVYAFEPHPLMHGYLKENCELNGIPEKVLPVQAALGQLDGRIRFTDGLESSINRVIQDRDPDQSFIEVAMHRADTWFASQGLLPSLVKVDVEGHEELVLEGFGDLLQSVDMLLVECRHPERIKDRLSSAGLAGPFQYSHKDSRFSRKPLHGEDLIHIHRRFIPILKGAGFEFEPDEAIEDRSGDAAFPGRNGGR